MTELSKKIKALDKMITDIDQRSRALKLRNEAELSQGMRSLPNGINL